VYDQCDHGGIYGTTAVYDANVKAKGGSQILPGGIVRRQGDAVRASAPGV
jgi:hypothetical protein